MNEDEVKNIDNSNSDASGNGSEGDGKGSSKPDEGKKTEGVSDIDRLIQAKADKLNAESGKKIASLQKELDKLRKEKMTAEELKRLEMTEKENALAEREKALLDKENRLTAIKAIKAAGLDDGSENALALIDFVVSGADDEEKIKANVKAFGDLVNKFVESKVNERFKANGRNPSGSAGSDGSSTENSIAKELAKRRNEAQKRSKEILDSYLKR